MLEYSSVYLSYQPCIFIFINIVKLLFKNIGLYGHDNFNRNPNPKFVMSNAETKTGIQKCFWFRVPQPKPKPLRPQRGDIYPGTGRGYRGRTAGTRVRWESPAVVDDNNSDGCRTVRSSNAVTSPYRTNKVFGN